MSVNRVEIVINSRRYAVLADESEKYIKKLADHIDQKVKLVLGSGQNVTGERPVVLAALNICDEYFKCEETCRLLGDQLDTQNKKLEEAHRQINELKRSDPQISLEEEEAIMELDGAKKRIKELEDKLSAIQSNARPYYSRDNSRSNDTYNNHNR